MDPELNLEYLARTLGQRLRQRHWMMTGAESCTGGWLGKVITDIPGSSAWFERGFITYTNSAKEEMLGVSKTTLQQHGAVSEAVACDMAEGALRNSHAHVSVAITGIAGPGGGTAVKPVGMVCLAWAGDGLETISTTCQFAGDRETVRQQAVAEAIHGLLRMLDGV